jgi:hypothetical protein
MSSVPGTSLGTGHLSVNKAEFLLLYFKFMIMFNIALGHIEVIYPKHKDKNRNI